MRVVDVHNHFYPPAYIDALRAGDSTVKMTIVTPIGSQIRSPATR